MRASALCITATFLCGPTIVDQNPLKPVVRLQTKAPKRGAEANVDDRKGVQSVDRAVDILAVIESTVGPMSVADLSKALDSTPSKIHRYLVSLVRCGALRQTGKGAYDLGPATLSLVLSALSRMDTVDRTCAAAEALRNDLGEAVFVAVWGNRGPTIVRYFESFTPMTVEARAGVVLPILTSATGRVFLAWGNEIQLASLLEGEAGDARRIWPLIPKSVRKTHWSLVALKHPSGLHQQS